MMVAPVQGRSTILVGKCLGGTTSGTIQGVMMIAIGALGGVPLTPTTVLTLVAELLVVCFCAHCVRRRGSRRG